MSYAALRRDHRRMALQIPVITAEDQGITLLRRRYFRMGPSNSTVNVKWHLVRQMNLLLHHSPRTTVGAKYGSNEYANSIIFSMPSWATSGRTRSMVAGSSVSGGWHALLCGEERGGKVRSTSRVGRRGSGGRQVDTREDDVFLASYSFTWTRW